MKKLLFLSMTFIAGTLVYALYFFRDGTQSSETFSSVIVPLMAICGFFGAILFIIGKRGNASH
jgi:hypothetical protein